MKELNSLGTYTRGSEALGHFVTMFGAGLRRHLLVSLIVGLAAGSLSLWSELDAAALDYVPGAVFFDLAASVSPDFAGLVTVPGHQPARLTNIEASRRYAAALDGRPGLFLVRQWLFRSLAVAALVFPLLLYALLAFGRQLSTTRTIRGALLLDTLTRAYRTRHTRRLLLHVAAGAGLGAGLCAVVTQGMDAVVASPSLLLALLATRLDPVSTLMSPLWDGAAIWVHHASVVGFVTPDAQLSAWLWGALRSTLGAFAAGGACGGAAAAALTYWRRPKIDPTDLELGGIQIPRKREVYHFLLCGATGSGKSVAAKHLLDQVRARGQRAIVFDTKGEYVEQYYRPGKDIILNPLDARSAYWTPWADVRQRADYLSLGKSLFPQGSGSDKFWSVAGASLFAALTQQATVRGYATTHELARMLTLASLDDVKAAIAGTSGERFMDEAAGSMSTSLLATLTAQLEAFTYLPHPPNGTPPFSIRNFIETENDAWLFLVMRAEDEAAIRPLVSMWYDIAINAVLALPTEDDHLPADKRRRIWAFLDEVARLQRLPALEGALREGRGKGLAMLLGLQSIGDIRDAYGRDKADSILGQPQIRLVLRTVEADTASWLERLLGKAEHLKSQESLSMGANAQRDGVNIQRQSKEESVVMAAEIQNLPDLTGYLKLPTGPVYKVRYTYVDRPIRNPAFIPTTWTAPEAEPGPDPDRHGPNELHLDYLAEPRRLWAAGDPDAALEYAMAEFERIGPGNEQAGRVLTTFIEQGMAKRVRGKPLPATEDGGVDWDAVANEGAAGGKP